MKTITTPLVYAVHNEDDSPVFGESTTHVSVDDEAGGSFIVIKQFCQGEQKLRFDMDELELVLETAKKLMEAQPK